MISSQWNNITEINIMELYLNTRAEKWIYKYSSLGIYNNKSILSGEYKKLSAAITLILYFSIEKDLKRKEPKLHRMRVNDTLRKVLKCKRARPFIR